MDIFDNIFSEIFGDEYFGKVKEIMYPCFWIDESEELHDPCTVQIMEKQGKLDYYYYSGKVYPDSIYTWLGKLLPFSTEEQDGAESF